MIDCDANLGRDCVGVLIEGISTKERVTERTGLPGHISVLFCLCLEVSSSGGCGVVGVV